MTEPDGVTVESIARAKAVQLRERAAVEAATGWTFHGDRLLPTDGVRLGLTLRNAILGAVYGTGRPAPVGLRAEGHGGHV